MKIKKTITALLLFLMLVPAAFSNELWDRAKQYVNTNSQMPGWVTKIQKVYDGSTLLETEVTEMKVEKDSSGTYELVLLKKTQDKKDITKKYRKTFEKQDKNEFNFDLYYLFSQGDGKSISYEETGRTKTIRSYECKEFSFRFSQDGIRLEGTVYLDSKSGCPLELKAQVKSVPIKTDEIKITSVEFITTYSIFKGKMYISKTDEKAVFIIPGYDFVMQSNTNYIYSDHK